MAVRPIRAKATVPCPACGEMIVSGKHQVMKRFKFDDWVHNRKTCLYSTQRLGVRAALEG